MFFNPILPGTGADPGQQRVPGPVRHHDGQHDVYVRRQRPRDVLRRQRRSRRCQTARRLVRPGRRSK